MQDLLKVAIPGTARQASEPTASDHPADRLVQAAAVEQTERELLLRAGTRAVYCMAGLRASAAPEPPAPAAEETLPECSLRAGQLLLEMLPQEPLFLGALTRLAEAGLRVPHPLLPTLLDRAKPATRAAMRRVLGERGQWLARFQDDWRWAAAPQAGQPGQAGQAKHAAPIDPAAIKPDWDDGTIDQRRAILQSLRQADAALARSWLEEIWAKEKAEHRAALLETFLTGLSPADEPLLEAALADRSKRVQAVAADCLARLPESAFARRMQSRADALLAYLPPKPAGRLRASLGALVGGKAPVGTLTAAPPLELDEAWRRDGIQEKPPQEMGKRAFWLMQVLSLVPPTRWESRFNLSPPALCTLAAADEYGAALLDGWSRAAMTFGCPNWIEALWDFWFETAPDDKRGIGVAQRQAMLEQLFAKMPPKAAERRVIECLKNPSPVHPAPLADWLSGLPQRWSAALGAAYLAELRKHFARGAEHRQPAAYAWLATLVPAAAALPAECLAQALEWIDSLAKGEDDRPHWRSILDAFAAAIRLRQEFAREVPLPDENGTRA